MLTTPARRVRLWRTLFIGLFFVSTVLGAVAYGHATTTPTVQGAAYGHLKKFMGAYEKAGFSRVVKIGDMGTYRTTLGSVAVKVDTSLTAVAKYDPKTNTITFSKDPRTVPAADSLDFGETVWHELTHAIEDAHGDIGFFDSEAYAERNIDYMTHVTRVALPILHKMETDSKKGLGAAKLEVRWRSFLKQVANASTLPSTKEYPPNLELMSQWFGFKVNPEEVKTMYLKNKAFSGKKWSQLRRALKGEPLTWTGQWKTNWGVMSLSQAGTSVGGAYTHDHGKIKATTNGKQLTGRWSEYPSYAGPRDAGTITFTMSADGKSFTGSWTYDGGGGGDWTGTRLK